MPSSRRGRDAGSATLELVLLTPLLVLLALVVMALGRITDARVRVEDAAHQAARAASLTYDGRQTEQAATEAAASALSTDGPGCHTRTVRLRHSALRPDSTVTATVTCRTQLRDLLGARLPGAVDITASSTSPVDRYRSSP